jgi:hypothetical protein
MHVMGYYFRAVTEYSSYMQRRYVKVEGCICVYILRIAAGDRLWGTFIWHGKYVSTVIIIYDVGR